MNNDEAAIAEILNKWAAAVHARDIDGVTASHDPNLLYFDVVGPAKIDGIDAYRKSWLELFFPWHGGTGKFELNELRVNASQDVGFATALLGCEGIEKGERVAFTVRLTVGLVKRVGEWIVVHEHHSESLSFDQNKTSPA
ncbi:MAG: nuclear transport factor 2 family protein [Sphingorhabdus sp.]|uniref:YybH family protein n=1 Tax=Sphingorhabdus sp. TaxID=1902408 RepID=UPI003CB6591F